MSLMLIGCKVTDEIVVSLSQLSHLLALGVSGTQISESGREFLRSRIPQCYLL